MPRQGARIADDMVKKGYIQYVLPDEGELVSYHEQRLADFGLEGTASKVEFMQADACNLKPLYTDYDLVFAGDGDEALKKLNTEPWVELVLTDE